MSYLTPFLALFALIVAAQACGGNDTHPAQSSTGSDANTKPSQEAAEEPPVGTADVQSVTLTGQAQMYSWAIYRHNVDGDTITIDVSDDPDRCAKLKAQKAANGKTETAHAVVVDLYRTDAAKKYTLPTELGDYPIQPIIYVNSGANERWASLKRTRPGDAYGVSSGDDQAAGGHVQITTLNVTSQGSVIGSLDTAVDQGQTTVRLNFNATFCDLPNYY